MDSVGRSDMLITLVGVKRVNKHCIAFIFQDLSAILPMPDVLVVLELTGMSALHN